MDFKGQEYLMRDSLEDNENYSRVDTEKSEPIGRSDFEKAKAFLMSTDQGLNISVYDHLADVIKAILRSKIPGAVNKLEEISLDVKKTRQKPESDLTEVFEIPEELQEFVKEKKIFYKFKTAIPEAEIVSLDEEEEESDDDEEEEADAVEVDSSEVVVEEPNLCEVLPDISYVMSRFNEAGIGLSPMELFELTVALKDLAIQFKLKKVRFWGKMFGMKNDYYIAESPYQEGIFQENFGWEDPAKKKKSEEAVAEKDKDEEDEEEDKVEEEPEEGDGLDEDDKVEEKEEEEEAKNEKIEEENEKEEEEKEAVKIPLVLEPKEKIKKRIPAEKKGTGVNEYLYFVCTKHLPDEEMRILIVKLYIIPTNMMSVGDESECCSTAIYRSRKFAPTEGDVRTISVPSLSSRSETYVLPDIEVNEGTVGEPWRVLPFMIPMHISEARHIKLFFTGDLEFPIKRLPYPGKEAHYLRAQIARITATTYIAPVGFFKSTDEDEEENDDEETDAYKITLNPEFEPKTVKYLLSEDVEGWCHTRKAILYQGRCIPMKMGEKDEEEDEGKPEDEDENGKEDGEPKDEDEDDEETKEEEDPEILEAIAETQVPVLRSLSEDKGIGSIKPWTMKLSSKLVKEKAILVLHSNIWPGAYTFYDGKNFEHIYIGYGFKYSLTPYTPPVQVEDEAEAEAEVSVDEELMLKEDTKEDAEGDGKGGKRENEEEEEAEKGEDDEDKELEED